MTHHCHIPALDCWCEPTPDITSTPTGYATIYIHADPNTDPCTPQFHDQLVRTRQHMIDHGIPESSLMPPRCEECR